MACSHKFQNVLNLAGLDYEPTTLIVGTFNPEWPEGNYAEWFYGRTHDEHGNQNNNFWDVLPRLYGLDSLINNGPGEWKSFCKKHRIAITDLLSSINDADENNPVHRQALKTYGDKYIAEVFEDHTSVSVSRILSDIPSIRFVYFTRRGSGKLWRKLWRRVRKYCDENEVRCEELLTPSGQAWRQHRKFNNQHQNQPIDLLADYILMRWRQKWHF